MPLISVIVPVYNAEHKLSRCINSILNQTFKDFELLLMDDGSSDNCGKICDAFLKKDMRVIVIHQENLGVSAARNTGIKIAKGEYIGFVDSDDYIDESYFESLVKTAKENNIDIAMCNFFMCTKNNDPRIMRHGFPENTVLGKDNIKNILYHNIFENKDTVGYFSLWNKLFRRDLIIDNSITMNSDMSFGEDMLFIMDCLKYCKSIAFTENAGYFYEMTENGLFSRYRRSFVYDITKCYSSLIVQTAPENYAFDDIVPLSVKYWNYINRQISAIVMYEKHSFLQIRKVFKNKTVRSIFSLMANISANKANELNIAQNELKPARLLNIGLATAAAFVADYQFNKDFWLRRLRK